MKAWLTGGSLVYSFSFQQRNSVHSTNVTFSLNLKNRCFLATRFYFLLVRYAFWLDYHMGETARKICPCLEALWDRMFGKSADRTRPDQGSSIKGVDGFDCTSVEDPMETTSRYASHSFNGSIQPNLSPESSIYRALWSFEAREEAELSFRNGDLFKIINRNGDWWTARKIDRNGRTLATGIVPYNYLASGEADDAQP